MQEILPFMIRHWPLCLLVVMLLVLLIQEEYKNYGGSVLISPQQVVTAMNRKQAQIIDIRDQRDYNIGHIVDSIWIDQGGEQALSEALQLYQDRLIIIVADGGPQAMKVIVDLRKAGFEKLQGLAGGFPAWKAAGFPLVKTSSRAKIKRVKLGSK